MSKSFKLMYFTALFVATICISAPCIGSPVILDRDPFIPVTHSSLRLITTKNGLKQRILNRKISVRLAGIIWDQQLPYALLSVNGKSQPVGLKDKVKGYQVTHISKKSITLKSKSKKIILSLGEKSSL